MGEVLRFNGAVKRGRVNKFKVHSYWGNYFGSTDLLGDFIQSHDLVLHKWCFTAEDSGDYTLALRELDDFGNSVYVNVVYEGGAFEITEEHPRAREVVDLFTKHLADNGVPWKKLG